MNSAKRVLWLTGVAHASSHAWELIFPAIAVPMARELGFSFEETIPLSFGLYLLFGLGAPVSGALSDRIGPRKVLLFGLLAGGLSGLALLWAPPGWPLFLALGGIGLAASVYHPAGLGLLSRSFEKTGRAFAINGMAGNVGIALTPLLAGIIASTLGWRWAYAVICSPALLFGLVFAFLPFDDRVDVHAQRQVQREPFRLAPVLIFTAALIAGGLAYRIQTLVLPALLQERLPGLGVWVSSWFVGPVKSPGNLAAGALTSAAYLMGIFGQWMGGRFADHRPLVTSYALFHAIALPFAALASWVGGVPLVLMIFGYLFFAMGMQPIENTIVKGLAPASHRGRAYAAKFVLSFGVGSFGTHVVSALTPRAGLGGSLVAVAGLEATLVLAALLLARALERAPKAVAMQPETSG